MIGKMSKNSIKALMIYNDRMEQKYKEMKRRCSEKTESYLGEIVAERICRKSFRYDLLQIINEEGDVIYLTVTSNGNGDAYIAWKCDEFGYEIEDDLYEVNIVESGHVRKIESMIKIDFSGRIF